MSNVRGGEVHDRNEHSRLSVINENSTELWQILACRVFWRLHLIETMWKWSLNVFLYNDHWSLWDHFPYFWKLIFLKILEVWSLCLMYVSPELEAFYSVTSNILNKANELVNSIPWPRYRNLFSEIALIIFGDLYFIFCWYQRCLCIHKLLEAEEHIILVSQPSA